VGLPTGAGIGTLATQPGVPPADVDLIAPNGIVDAGDAGIRVSGNFNVFAVQILGADNIEVAGVAKGLPEPPAAPNLDLDNTATKASEVTKAIQSALADTKKNAGIKAPSIIEVRVVGYGDACAVSDASCGKAVEAPGPVTEATSTKRYSAAISAVIPIKDGPGARYAFDMPPQSMGDAIRSIGRQTNTNILYDAATLGRRQAPALRGDLTPDQALRRLLRETGMILERTGPNTLLLRDPARPS
jgi:hypothetical protein